MMNKTAAPTRWWDLPAASLLLVCLLAATTRLVATRWTDSLSITETLVVLGLMAGLALGKSRFSPRLAFFFGLAYGIFFVGWSLGSILNPDIPWLSRLAIIASRLMVIVHQLATRQIVQDSLLFLVLMAALFWALSVHAGYTLTRWGNAWQSILPTGLALFALHSFDMFITRRAWYLAVYLFFALVLVARMSYLQQHDRWQQSRTALPPHLGLDFIRFALLATSLIVLFSWTAPALADAIPSIARAAQPAKDVWNDIRDQWDNAFASLRSSVGIVSDYYGSSVILGRGNRLTDAQVFFVNIPKETPPDTHFYWQARTYDTYQDGQWLSAYSNSVAFNPNQDKLNLPKDEQGRWLGGFKIVAATYLSTLFSPPQPTWVNMPAQMELIHNPDGTQELTAFRASPALAPGGSYYVSASVSNATVAELREAGTNYPKWVVDHYLQVPSSVSNRTTILAEQITNGQKTPYDQAVAITEWLRNNIKYSETVPERPVGQEAIDWFLFDSREGFCNYYASAEVIMLRSLGVPARWAAGFAQGEKINDDTYLIRQRDAHAWPEVYFPGLGWVEFEPTAARPAIAREPGVPTSLSTNSDAEAQLRAEQEQELREAKQDHPTDQLYPSALSGEKAAGPAPWVYPVGGLSVTGLAVFLLWRYRNRLHIEMQPVPVVIEATMLRVGLRPPAFIRNWARHASLPPLTKAYLELNRALRRLGNRPEPTATPSERARDLAQILPPAEPPADRLVNEYQVAIFSPQPADLPAARLAGQEIRKLSYQHMVKSFGQRLLRRFQRPAPTSPLARR